ncbi:hypothetical protein AB9P05_06625 [Roseivirga sp. BDSF3-8]|uniref:hypothetical protein n=1 Tax=Roseivirga sp. BDSF3-8 TaxID=3241598 RepID=UPI003532706E
MKRLLLPALLGVLLLSLACADQEAISPLEALDNPYARVDHLISTARATYETDPKEAEQAALKALEIAKAEYYLKGIQNSHNVLQWVYLYRLQDNTKATYHQQEYEIASHKLEKVQDIGALNYSKGHHLYALGKYTEATPFLFEAYESYLETREPEKAGYSLYTISLIFQQTGWPEKGIQYLNKIHLDEIPASFQVSVLKLKGVLYYELQQYDKAISSYTEGMSVAKAERDKVATLKLMNALTLPLIDSKAYDEARRIIGEGKSLAQELNDREKLGEVLQKEGLLYERLGAYERAIEANKTAGGLFRYAGNQERMAMVQLDLSHLHKLKGEYEKALAAGLEGTALENISHQTKTQLYNNLSTIAQLNNDQLNHFRYENEALRMEKTSLENSHHVGVHKAELDYRTMLEDRALDELLVTHEENRFAYDLKRYAILASVVLMACVLVMFLLNQGPMRRYDKLLGIMHQRMMHMYDEVGKSMERLNKLFPLANAIHKPAPPDEHDIHRKRNQKGGTEGE